MLSFWEQAALEQVDYLVVGAGLMGMQTALCLREQNANARIVVLERHAPPRGASTRNAGFACFGSPGELLDDIKNFGEGTTLAVVERRYRGLRKLRQTFGDEVLNFEAECGHEVLDQKSALSADAIGDLNRQLQPIFAADVFSMPPALAERYGFSARHVSAVVKTRFEGALDSGRLSRALQTALRAADIELLCGVEAQSLHIKHQGAELHAVSGRTDLRFSARAVALCANSAIPGLLATLDDKDIDIPSIQPGRGQVLITNPIEGLPWSGVFHADRGFLYFRRVADRVLLGGARNRDFSAEQTESPELNSRIQEYLEQYLRDVILPGRKHTVERRWAGIMGFTPDKQACVKQLAPYIFVGFACNGMGVALSAEASQRTAQLIIEAQN